jgi:GT2 family glycosyltransferase
MHARSGLVCIVLVNWNGWRDTVECVRSCAALDYRPFRVIVVDNGSTDDSVDRLQAEFGAREGVSIIETGANLGFAGGNNVGIRHAMEGGAEYVWLLNNDTVVEPCTLSALTAVFAEQPSAGIAGSKIYYFDRPEVISSAGGRISPRLGLTTHIGDGEADAGQYDTVRDVDYVTGASLLVRTSVVEAIGPMDESYFLYWEETDWCERAHTAGWRVLYAPASRVWHKVGASTATDKSYVKARYEGRNRIEFHQRNRPGQAARVAALALMNALYLVVRGRPRTGLWMARGVFDALSHHRGAIDS